MVKANASVVNVNVETDIRVPRASAHLAKTSVRMIGAFAVVKGNVFATAVIVNQASLEITALLSWTLASCSRTVWHVIWKVAAPVMRDVSMLQ